MTSQIWRLFTGNFLTSLAGGVVLARGLSLMKDLPGFFGDSILTYLFGGLLSFGVVMRLRSKEVYAVWPFTLTACLSAMALFFVATALRSHGNGSALQILLLVLMSVFFAATITTRSFRSDIAASEHAKLPLAEVAYAAGYLVGLGLTTVGFVETMTTAFVGASFALFLAVLVDLSLSKQEKATHSDSPPIAIQPLDRSDWVLVSQFTAMAVGVQIFLQRLSTIKNLSMPLAALEIGVLLATVVSALVVFTLRVRPNGGLLSGVIELSLSKRVGASSIFVVTIASCLVGLAVMSTGTATPVVAAMFFIASFGYEFLSLALLQRIGRNRGNVAIVFATTSVIATTAYGMLLLMPKPIGSLVFTVIVFFVVSAAHEFAAVRRTAPAPKIQDV